MARPIGVDESMPSRSQIQADAGRIEFGQCVRYVEHAAPWHRALITLSYNLPLIRDAGYTIRLPLDR